MKGRRTSKRLNESHKKSEYKSILGRAVESSSECHEIMRTAVSKQEKPKIYFLLGLAVKEKWFPE